MQNLKPALVLAFIIPFLTELLTGNTPAHLLFEPVVYLLSVASYGFPCLLARELFLKWNLTLPGLFLLGLAYGIYNEGVCAKTLLMNEHAPMPIGAFDHYAWLGINFAWASTIVPWHAIHSIIYPIALVTWWFPSAARQSWLSRSACWPLAVIVVLVGLFFHMVSKKAPASPLHLLFFIAVMIALILLSKRMSRAQPFLQAGGHRTLMACIAGFMAHPFLLGITFMAVMKLPGILICLASALLIAGYYRLIVKREWLATTPFVLFGLGDYLAGASFSALIAQSKGGGEGLLASLLLIAAFLFGILKCGKEDFVSPAPQTTVK